MSFMLDNLPPWPQLSFVLAKQVLRLDIPQTFLTATEQESFTQALTSFDSWTSFISKDHINVFRVRAMISEQLIPFFSNRESDCCQSPLDLKDLCLQAHQIQQSSPVPAPLKEFVNSDHVPLLDIFHTLEFDMADMMEQRKLDEYKAQEEAQEEESAPTFTILDENDHSSLKYLLKGISENRSKTSLSDRELRNLLLDAKPHRSKWANDDKIGQEDLYEACEKVLTDLKNYTEHSTPFLSKVNKREAPDYLEVIKEPMDLGLVAKKLKHCQYKNKREFANDLYLIYENCLAYNTNPGSEFRKHAIAMKRKTDRLLARVPEISIKERSEHDMEEMEETDDEDTKSRERSMTHESLDDVPLRPHYGGKHPQKGNVPLKPLNELDDDPSTAPIDTGELQNKIWTEVTKNTRAKLTTDIEKQYQFEFGNRRAMYRSCLDMERFSRLEHLHHQPELTKKLMRCSPTAFVRWVDRHEGSSVHDVFDLNSEDEEGFDGGFFFSSKTRSEKLPPTDEEDALRTDLFLPEYYLLSGVPEIPGVAEEYFTQEELEDETDAVPSFDVYVATKPPQTGLIHSIDHNIEMMQHNRSIYNKCMAIRNNQPISTDIPEISTYPSPPLTQMVDAGTPTPSAVQHTPPMLLNKQASSQILQRSVSQILQHAGFESTHSTALNVLTDMMSEYLTTIAKTARKYWDQHGNSMSGEDILQHTLNENNVESVDTLDRYVTDDIQKYGNRLLESRRKLENSYRELAMGSTEEIEEDQENDEALINGLFNQDLGEDFFGFKELGLEEVFQMRSLTVPPRLLIGKDKPLIIAAKPEPKLKYPPPPSFIPATPYAFIGLLKPWFQSRPNTVEDEYIPKKSSRPRQPPVNLRSAYLQHQQTKRRVLKDGSNTQANEEAKRKRKRAMEESKALKKKQRLELKQLKLAEKEQKKKLREEEKLAKKKV